MLAKYFPLGYNYFSKSYKPIACEDPNDCPPDPEALAAQDLPELAYDLEKQQPPLPDPTATHNLSFSGKSA
jgi:hypothetical protein